MAPGQHFYRKGESTVPRKFDLITLLVTSRCNLRCEYCSMAAGPGGGGTLSLERLERRLSAVLALAGPGDLRIHFSGGEPLLAGAAWLAEACERSRSAAGRAGLQCQFFLQSNGTLLDAPTLDVLMKQRVSVSLSLDGPPPINARTRGHGEATVRAFHRLRDAGNDPGVILCLTRRNAEDLPRILEWLESEGMFKVRINPWQCIGRAQGHRDDHELSPVEHLDTMAVILDFMEHDGHRLREYNASRLVQRHHAGRAGRIERTDLCDAFVCSAGRRMLSLTPGGRWIPCPRFFSEMDAPGAPPTPAPGAPEWEDWVDRRIQPGPEWSHCFQCDAFPICDFGCAAVRTARSGPPARMCERNRGLMRMLDQRAEGAAVLGTQGLL